MKILHVFTIPATAETFFDRQFGYLAENGHQITVIANAPLDPDFCRRNKVDSETAPIARRISPLSDLKAIAAIRRKIIRENYDTVVGHTPKGAMVAMIAALLARTPHRVYYRHGLIYTTATGLRRTLLKTVERITSLCATNIVNVSPSLSLLAVKDHLNPDSKQTVIGKGTCGGIDTQTLFNPTLIDPTRLENLRQQLGILSDHFVIGFCGRLCRDKGIVELIEGFEIFKKNNPGTAARLLLIGRFDERDALDPQTKEKIINSPDIIATGAVDHTILPHYYALMDVFVFPSYREGFGMCVIEASAMQIPVLVSRSHGCIDSIQEHRTGEYIDIAPEAIAKGIEAMTDPVRKTTYGQNGRQWTSLNFDFAKLWPKIKEFYNGLR